MKYIHDDRGPGEFGKVCTRAGKPSPRPKGSKPPCAWCPKIFPGDDPNPDNAQELSETNQQVYRHYLECKAVGQWPADPICRYHARLCQSIEDVADKISQQRFGLTVLNTIMRRG